MNTNMIILAIAIVLISLLGAGFYRATKLKTIHITKSVIIDGSKQDVFNMVRFQENFPQWSPFLAQDPGQKVKVTGEDGQPGAQYHWEGRGGKDVGFQELVEFTDSSYVKFACTIEKPFKANPTFEYSFSEAADGITVTQDFHLESGLVDAFFMGIFGAKKEMEHTNQMGMGLLKTAIEKG
ncbi:MAG: SRPBCC family protein [Bacteroidota bacterium]